MENSEEFLKFINLARENPAYFVPIIEKQLALFVNQKEMALSQGVLYETNEGKSAWLEAKNFLKAQTSLKPFIKHIGLCRSAMDHVNDLVSNGNFGHKGSDGSNFTERILRHCKKTPGAMAEIIGADFDLKNRNVAEMTILSLIIDDGVSDRGHRRTIFSPSYNYIGWSCAKQEQKWITVFNLTENNLETFYTININEKTTGNKENIKQRYASYTTTARSPMDPPVKDPFGRNTFSYSKPEELPQQRNSFASQFTDNTNLVGKKGKKVVEKRENIRNYQENAAKIIETTTQLIYSDGTTEETIDRRTIYLD